MDRKAQKELTLQALKDAGDAGLSANWFYSKNIMRGAARIHDLKKVGYLIEGKQVGRFYRYYLRPSEQMGLEGIE